MTLQKNLSNIMNAIRRNRDQSLTTFAKELDISRSSLQEILNGTGNPRMDTIEHIANRLNMDPLALLSCSYSEEQLEIAMPLLKITDTLSGLPEEKRHEFIVLFQGLLQIVAEPKT